MAEESTVQYVHFRVGEDLGLRLMEIAQEHLTERNDPIKALKTITESLAGCPTDVAVQILLGNLVLPVDVESQQVICQERVAGEHDRFPKLDPIYFMESRTRKIKLHGGYLLDGFKAVQYEIRKNSGCLNISFNYEDIFKFIAGDNEVLLEELRDNREIDGIASLFETAKRFIEETMKTQSTMEWLMKMCDDFKDSKNYEYYMQLRGDIADTLVDIAYHLNQTLKLDFVIDGAYVADDNVQNYIESAIKIDQQLSKGIFPVDILANWSAGWLCPSGNYYGLNGEIANMLHNQIADALKDAGIIPEDEVNPDAWLEQEGWVKIHGNNINFAGCCNVHIGKKNVDLTDIQIEKICDYIHQCHGDKIKLGWKLELISLGTFKMLANNLQLMNSKYFEF